MDYTDFIRTKSQIDGNHGFEPLWLPDSLFPFQRHLVEWSIRKGRGAEFADCLGGESVINSPDGDITIEDAFNAGNPLRVYALDGSRVVIADSSAPFVNGVNRLYRFVMRSGRTITATMGHRFLTSSGWRRGESLRIGERLAVSDASRLRSISGTGLSALRGDVPRSFQKAQGCLDDYCHGFRQCDAQPLSVSGSGRVSFPSQVDAHGHNLTRLRMDVQESISGYSRHHRPACRLSIDRFSLQAVTTEGVEEFQTHAYGRTCTDENNRTSRLIHEGTIPERRVPEFHPSEEQQSEGDRDRAFLTCDSSLCEWDTLVAIQYIRTDVFYDIEVPGPANFLADGVWSHNCGLGKTLMELVWAENVLRHTNRPVLLLTPLAVAQQTELEAAKFGIEAKRSKDGKHSGGIVITNYERLHYFDKADFAGVVCDESAILKNFDGATKAAVTEFMRTIDYRLLGTATAAPNDFHEVGTSSEALGYLGHRDMLTMFFKEDTVKDFLGWGRKAYRFRGHSREPFWRWVCSWARACRKPSDLGFDDGNFILPPLIEREHILESATPRDGFLFSTPARDLREQRDERRVTLRERAEVVAGIVAQHKMESPDRPTSVVWCHLNDEGKALCEMIPGAVEVKGSMSPEEKEERLVGFQRGQIEVLVTKPKIGAWGLNWQHCNNVVTFASHSFEQYYQLVRRCYRFGQDRPVKVTTVTTEGEIGVLANLQRKSQQASEMFDALVRNMNNELRIESQEKFTQQEKVPSWL